MTSTAFIFAPGVVQCYLHTGRRASVVRVSQ